ncbi:MAG: hypothetical protein AB7F31_03230 [Parachlamydiales bacterium]
MKRLLLALLFTATIPLMADGDEETPIEQVSDADVEDQAPDTAE